MLRVVYEAADDLQPGELVTAEEDRGLIRIRVDRNAEAAYYTEALTAELDRFLPRVEWFQFWEDDIVSPRSPDTPVRVVFELATIVDGPPVQIRERKGTVNIHVDARATVDEFVGALNPAIEKFLMGGQWFQLWQGEIVDIDSPDNPHQGGTVAGVHRGPLVHETP